jgi:hypothetical protein
LKYKILSALKALHEGDVAAEVKDRFCSIAAVMLLLGAISPDPFDPSQ